MKNYKSNLPINLDIVFEVLSKVDWYKVFSIIKRIKSFISILKAITDHATPEEKEQLSLIYKNVLERAKSEN